MIRKLSTVRKSELPVPGMSPCDHRTVSKDGRIICAKIVEGDNAVSPEICQTCPVRAVNCIHLSFSLQQTSPSPLIVRFNGRTEVWDDDPPEVFFDQAACAAKVMPIASPRSCAGCVLRQPLGATTDRPPESAAPRCRRARAAGKVVPFPDRRAVVATG
jgi:hypothetical protein